ncbi:hypothetical protein BS78_02G220900 [Paspalum vaginatum]|nr:hypothetical protein BS78_02G220900 [Paspalum vaginatum]
MEATKERQQRQAADEGDTVQLPTETSPYVQHNDLEDYKMRGYGAQGQLPVSDVPHVSGTDAPTIPGTAVPVAKPKRHDGGGVHQVQHQRELKGAGRDAGRRGEDTATDTINRHGVP